MGVSSRCGSADVLKALGVNIDLRAAGVAACLEEAGIGFIFARHFHPAMRHVMPARRALGVRTFFNILGPLCNPAGVRRQVVGAFSPAAASMMAGILANLGAEHVVAVSATVGMDEFALEGASLFYEYRAGWSDVAGGTAHARDLGFDAAPLSALAGGSARDNAQLLLAVLSGARGPHRNVVLLNSAYGLLVSGRLNSLASCLAAARESIDSGAAMARLELLRTVSGRVA